MDQRQQLRRPIANRNIDITIGDTLLSWLLELTAIAMVYYAWRDITIACILGVLATLAHVANAYQYRQRRHYERIARDPHRVTRAEKRVAELQAQLSERPQHVAIIDKRNPSQHKPNNVLTLSNDVMQLMPQIAGRLIVQNAYVSRRGLQGILSRGKVERLQEKLLSADLIAHNGNGYALNDRGEAFFSSYLPDSPDDEN